MRAYERILDSVLFYPVSTVYLAAVAVAIAIAAEWFDLGVGIIALTGITIVVMGAGIMRELHIVHGICDGHTAELRERAAEQTARISDLTAALDKADVDIPDRRPGAEEQE